MTQPAEFDGAPGQIYDLEETNEPVRKLKARRWMRHAYILRVQKKWTKRFGTYKILRDCKS